MDRDGVINYKVAGYVTRVEDFHLLPGAAEAIARINASGWLVVLVTNQSVIGRGLATRERVDEIHRHMLSLLAEKGAHLDGIYLCPHTPWDGCPCRKPEPGMLLQAARDLDIDLGASVMIGDSDTDLEAGRRAGTWLQIKVDDGFTLGDAVERVLAEARVVDDDRDMEGGAIRG
ncbi:MAG: HAD family hydrolase [Thermoplasmata archaeon]|nr:HAD family hydrolase [Thermoplasmata archaeon]